MKRAVFSIRLTKEEQEQMARRCHFEKAQLYRIAALHEALLPLLRAEGCYELLSPEESGAILRGGAMPGDGAHGAGAQQDCGHGEDLPQAALQNEAARSEQKSEAMPERAALCAVTLGNGIDDMQALYGGAEAVMDDYILECLGSALLEKAYEELAGVLRRETGLFINHYLFPGSQTELSQVAEIVGRLSAGGERIPVSYNTEFVLTPKKSVIFIGILEEKKAGCGICTDCPKTDCENRKGQLRHSREKEERAKSSQTQKSLGKDRNYSYGYQRIFGKNDPAVKGDYL